MPRLKILIASALTTSIFASPREAPSPNPAGTLFYRAQYIPRSTTNPSSGAPTSHRAGYPRRCNLHVYDRAGKTLLKKTVECPERWYDDHHLLISKSPPGST